MPAIMHSRLEINMEKFLQKEINFGQTQTLAIFHSESPFSEWRSETHADQTLVNPPSWLRAHLFESEMDLVVLKQTGNML